MLTASVEVYEIGDYLVSFLSITKDRGITETRQTVKMYFDQRVMDYQPTGMECSH